MGHRGGDIRASECHINLRRQILIERSRLMGRSDHPKVPSISAVGLRSNRPSLLIFESVKRQKVLAAGFPSDGIASYRARKKPDSYLTVGFKSYGAPSFVWDFDRILNRPLD